MGACLFGWVLTLATWITASMPSITESKTPIWVKSSMTTKSSFEAYCGRAAFICSPFCFDLVDPRTENPRARRLSTTWAPMNPVAPVTRTYLRLLVGVTQLG